MLTALLTAIDCITVAMEVRETGLQAKSGFAAQTWPAGGAVCAGQTSSDTLLAKPNLLAKLDCRPNRVLLAKPRSRLARHWARMAGCCEQMLCLWLAKAGAHS